jgi:hypothetical protein
MIAAAAAGFKFDASDVLLPGSSMSHMGSGGFWRSLQQ